MTNYQPGIPGIQTDQLAAKYCGAYLFALVGTPPVDSLAAGGAVFDTAHTSFPYRFAEE